MADIALVFHWPPEAMDRMDAGALARWREKARVRLEAMSGDGAGHGRPPGRTWGL